MTSHPPNAVTGLPYTLVDIDERQAPFRERLRTADSLQWKLWIQKYAWFVSILTAAPGVALIVWVLTHDLAFALSITALATATPGAVFWWRTRQLP